MANKVTQTAGLIFNVNTVRNKLKEFYDSQGVSVPMFSGGQSSITGVLQKTLELLLKECIKHVGKDKSGVRQVNRDFLVHSVLLHAGLKQYFSVQLDRFSEKQMYGDQVPISRADIEKVMESVDKDLSFTPRARNMACFLLLEVFLDLAHTCSQMLEFSKKKSLDARCVMYGVSCKFPDNVASELRGEIVRVAKAFGDELEDNSGAGDTSEDVKPAHAAEVVASTVEVDAGDETQEVQTTAKGGKKPKAVSVPEVVVASTGKKPGVKSAKSAAAVVVEVEQEEDGGEEVEEVEVAEEVVEVQPKKPAVKVVAKPPVNNKAVPVTSQKGSAKPAKK